MRQSAQVFDLNLAVPAAQTFGYQPAHRCHHVTGVLVELQVEATRDGHELGCQEAQCH